MLRPECECPACGGPRIRVNKVYRRSYGRYRRLQCWICKHRWSEREAINGALPPERQQCPACKSQHTAVIESRVMSYGRRQRISCQSCSHRWTNRIEGSEQPRPHARREAGDLTRDEIELILLSTRSIRTVARELRVSPSAVHGVRIGQLRSDVLPDLPRQTARRRRSCTSCRFWNPDPEVMQRCRQGWPDPDEEGPGYANDCDDYEIRS